MTPTTALFVSALALGISAAGTAGARSPRGSSRPEVACRRAAQLVEDNSSDAVGGAREALENGIADLERALQRGCSDRKGALLSLALGYNTLAFRYAAEGSAERKRFEDLERATHRRLGTLAGSDAGALMLYAQALDDPSERIPVYTRIIRLRPGDSEAHVALAKCLIHAGRNAEAMRSFERGLAVADQDALNRLDPDVTEFLHERGLEKEADALRTVSTRRREIVGTPSGR